MVQEAPVAQAWPQPPQFAGSPIRSAQASPHSVVPDCGQTHPPLRHSWDAAQVVPQAPQFAPSEDRSAQVWPHSTAPPCGQLQVLFWHT